MKNVIEGDSLKSLTDLSKEIHISKSPLMKRMNKIPHFRQRFCTMKDNQLIISDKGISLIDYPKHNSTSKAFHTRKGVRSSKLTSAKKSEIINQLLGFNKYLKKQNRALKKRNNRMKLSPGISDKGLEQKINDYNSHNGLYRLFHKIKK